MSNSVTHLAPMPKRGLAQDVAERLRDAILRGYFAPGQALREEQLAATLEVSRGPIREAFTQLEREGLVLVRPNRGAFVARLSREDIDEVYSLRLVLERLAIQGAIHHATATDLDEMQAVVDAMAQAVARGITETEAAELDIRFHDLIYRAARHRRLYEAWSNLKSQIYLFFLSRNVANPDFRDMVVKAHTQILTALRNRNEAQAIRLTEKHMGQAYIRIVAAFGQDQPLFNSPFAHTLVKPNSLARLPRLDKRVSGSDKRARARRGEKKNSS